MPPVKGVPAALAAERLPVDRDHGKRAGGRKASRKVVALDQRNGQLAATPAALVAAVMDRVSHSKTFIFSDFQADRFSGF
jgi:hypothetical protein